MRWTRFLVATSALMFAAFGLNGLFHPAGVLDMIHAAARDVTALNEVRAMYGGFELGVATFLVACLLGRWSPQAGLFLTTTIFVAAAAARGKSVLVDGWPDPLFVKIWIFEIAFAVACVIAMTIEEDD